MWIDWICCTILFNASVTLASLIVRASLHMRVPILNVEDHRQCSPNLSFVYLLRFQMDSLDLFKHFKHLNNTIIIIEIDLSESAWAIIGDRGDKNVQIECVGVKRPNHRVTTAH